MTTYPHSNATPLEIFAYWVIEREKIRIRKESGKPSPYTTDTIFKTYRFCNANRENDRVTRWLAKHYRDFVNPYVWHAMIVARFINWTDTLAYCGYPEPWPTYKKVFTNLIKQLEKDNARIFTAAYIVSTNGATGSKVDHVLKLFDRAWSQLHNTFPKETTCQGAYEALRQVNGIGSFMAAQVVADIKYTKQLKNAPDWMNFVAPGPGSQRGLNRLLDYPLASQWDNKSFQTQLITLRKDAGKLHKPILDFHLQDIQNILCEVDKYLRVLHGQGKPRSQYRASTEPMP